MANVTPSIPATIYFSPQSVQLSFSADVEYVNYTIDGIQPTISEYIAYDTLTPPNPFIAVTQDGRGRVVYDGGFPKFYNSTAPAANTPFASLTASYKYLYNAINWTADPVKVAAGNKKILIMGDNPTSMTYAVKGTDSTSFRTSFTNLCTSVGFTPTFVDTDDYAGGYLNTTLATMNQYACILFMGARGGFDPKITNACVQDLQTFRIGGGGLIVITDDGPDIANIQGAYPPPQVDRQFFVTVNKLVVNFGAYFTGLYDRSPVNVGFLRSTYGDHPLYNGMANTESIYAGGSESKVVVATYPKYTNANMPAIPLTTDGRHTIRVLAKLNDGSVEVYQFVYAIVTGGAIEIRNAGGTSITTVDTGLLDNTTVYPVILGAGLGTIAGQVTVDGVKVGDLAYTEAGGSTVTWLNGSAVHVNNGSVIKAEILSPFNTFASTTVTRFQPDLSLTSSPAGVRAKLQPYFGSSSSGGLINAFLTGISATRFSAYAKNVATLRDYTKQ